MNAQIQPSKEWTEKERLALIHEHVCNAMNNRLILNPNKVAGIMDVIGVIATQGPYFLETNRSKVLRLEE